MRVSMTKSICALLLLLLVISQGFSQTGCYPNAPKPTVILADQLARDIVRKRKDPVIASQLVEGRLADLVFYAAADAAGVMPQSPPLFLEDFEHLGETARTDKQLGPSAKSNGSTSLVEKPGFTDLLGFAIDHGAIKQAVNGTTLTLSTSPYALIALSNRRDTADLYQRAGFLNRLGVSASFNIGNQNDVLSNATRRQLTEWSARARITGDRSARSKAFTKFWEQHIKEALQNRINILSRAYQAVVTGDAFMGPIYQKLLIGPDSLSTRVRMQFDRLTSASDDAATAAIKETILCSLFHGVYEPIKDHLTKDQLTKEEASRIEAMRQKIKSEIIPSLTRSDQEIVEARGLLEKEIQAFTSRPELTFEYTNHRDSTTSGFSELKLLFQADTKPLKVIANAGFSLYNEPNILLNQQRLRDYGGALSLEGTAPSPFTRQVDMSKITYSFSGSYERLKENEHIAGKTPDIASAQLKIEIPITPGLSLPITYTYSSATETMKKGENKFNVGFHVDMDKLYAIIRSQKQ